MKWTACCVLLGALPLTTGLADEPKAPNGRHYLSQPLVTSIYTADPSAHVFNRKIYVYPSHDVPTDIPDDDLGSEYAMHDYRVLEMDRIGGPVTVGPVALDVKDVTWAAKQLWAPDAAFRNGIYYLYFPARDKQGMFRIGVATSSDPLGPFKAEPQPIQGSFSIDPAVFTDSDGQSYMYFGGIWGGQLENWTSGRFVSGSTTDRHQDDQPALMSKVARLTPGMKQFAEPPGDVVILGEDGKPLLGGDHDRRFFEASWVFQRNGLYYFTYSTGDTHFLAYATGKKPRGPFQYKGHFLLPVQGWTTHHSIMEWDGKWWLFYADTQLSNKNHLRNVKVTELRFDVDGSIRTVDPFTASRSGGSSSFLGASMESPSTWNAAEQTRYAYSAPFYCCGRRQTHPIPGWRRPGVSRTTSRSPDGHE